MSEFDYNKLNSFIQQASTTISCGPECQQANEAAELKQSYLNAQTNVLTADSQLETAAKNYYTFTEGEQGYKVYNETQLNAQATEKITEFKTIFLEDVRQTLLNVNTYNILVINYQNIKELYEKYLIENIELEKKLKNETSDILTNERKTYYQDEGITKLSNVYKYYLVVIYFIIIIVAFCYFSYYYNPTTGIWVRIFVFIIAIILPFITPFLIFWTIHLIKSVYNMLPKNAHLDDSNNTNTNTNNTNNINTTNVNHSSAVNSILNDSVASNYV